MGEHQVHAIDDERQLRAFTRAVLQDIRALEMMLERDMIERDMQRMGVEQEMFLVDADCRPAAVSTELLGQLNDPRFTTELARFNLEVNLPPQPLDARFLSTLEQELTDSLDKVAQAAGVLGARVLLTGILPTLRYEDLGLDNLSPDMRYQQLNNAISRARGGAITVVIDGIDKYEGTHDSVVLEGANTSLQLHLQVEPESVARLYNLAQLTAAPLLAAATNSPILLGRRLWHETRIAVFERAVDARSKSQLARGVTSRVSFGHDWVRGSVLEILRDNAARYPVILTCDTDGNAVDEVERGRVPGLSALTLHNGTVWRWNRICYGVTEGKGHLRIESRVLPAGPTVLDEVANAALFYGMMTSLEEHYGDVSSRLPFKDAKTNFLAAAQRGLDARFTWLDGQRVQARELLLNELIPSAREGLMRAGVSAEDLCRYMDTVEERVRNGQTGSTWLLHNLTHNRDRDPDEVLSSAVGIMLREQQGGRPVHHWEPVVAKEHNPGTGTGQTVGKIMTRDVFTVRPDDFLDLATSVMSWKHIRHVPVENEAGELVGLLSTRELLHSRERESTETSADPVAVETVMNRNPVTVSPETPLIDAMRLLLSSESGCLLVVSRQQLLGIVTERDFVRAAATLLED